VSLLHFLQKKFRCKLKITVRYGSNNIINAKEVTTHKYKIHPNYWSVSYLQYDSDLAIVTLPPKTFQFDDGTVNAICLPIGLANKSFWGRRLTIVGWGKVDNYNYPQQLQKAYTCIGCSGLLSHREELIQHIALHRHLTGKLIFRTFKLASS
jgi:hypothetical protein